MLPAYSHGSTPGYQSDRRAAGTPGPSSRGLGFPCAVQRRRGERPARRASSDRGRHPSTLPWPALSPGQASVCPSCARPCPGPARLRAAPSCTPRYGRPGFARVRVRFVQRADGPSAIGTSLQVRLSSRSYPPSRSARPPIRLTGRAGRGHAAPPVRRRLFDGRPASLLSAEPVQGASRSPVAILDRRA